MYLDLPTVPKMVAAFISNNSAQSALGFGSRVSVAPLGSGSSGLRPGTRLAVHRLRPELRPREELYGWTVDETEKAEQARS